jgi:P-type E1-E2 ATPase
MSLSHLIPALQHRVRLGIRLYSLASCCASLQHSLLPVTKSYCLPAVLQAEADAAGIGRGLSPCYVLLDGHLAALLLLGDHARPEAAAAVQELQQQGLACAMMTGDSAAAAAAVAAAMGIPAADTHSNLLPEDKLQLLQQYKRQYKAVAHVGDGINDAPALANADVGIAMGVAGSQRASCGGC